MSNDVMDMVKGMLTGYVTERNEITAEIGALTGDRTKLVHDYLTDENTEDDKIREWQEWDEAAAAAREEQAKAVREYVAGKYLPEIDEEAVKTKQAKADELLKSIKAARKFAETVPGYSEEALADVPALLNQRGSAAGSGTGSKRPRLNRISYRLAESDPWIAVETTKKDKEGNDVTVTNFSLLATTLRDAKVGKVSVPEIQAAAFAEAGTDDLSTVAGTVFDFVIAIGDNNVSVQVEPKGTDA